MGNIEKFDSMAKNYDTIERANIAKIIANNIKKYVTGGNEKIAMDYGCGTGLVGMELLDTFKSMLFVDASYNMVQQVNEKLEKLHITNANTLCCDLVKECPQNLHVDYVIIAQVLLHMKEDVNLLLSKAFNLLNDGGHLLIVDFDKNHNIISNEVHNGFVQEELNDILKQIGFTKVQGKTFYHGEKIFMNQDASLFIMDAKKNLHV